MSTSRRSTATEAPIIAAVAAVAIAREATVRMADASAELAKQDAAWAAALEEVDKVRKFVGTPDQILGNPSTKHGEIAEAVEVGIRRARQLLVGELLSARKHPDRTGAIDYLIDGDGVQSKFINGTGKTLEHVRKHMVEHTDFGRDGSYYHIARDHHAIIEKALRGGGHPGLSKHTLSRIAAKAREIQRLCGRGEFNQVVRPGISDYADVQQGRIHGTLNAHERDLGHRNEALEEAIHDRYAPNLVGAVNAAAQGIAAGAAIRFVAGVHSNYKGGKRIWYGDYTPADWSELGVDVGEGAVLGGVSAAAIYGLTNYADLAAPFAGAVVASALSVTALALKYQNGELSLDEFCELGQLACIEGAAVGLATALGQSLIPVPVFGGLLGAAAGRLLVSASKDALARDAQALRRRLHQQYDECRRGLDQASRAALADLLARYDALGDLMSCAFDFELNAQLRFAASIELAQAFAVPESEVIRSVAALDDFMQG